jgi:hypothetical protein
MRQDYGHHMETVNVLDWTPFWSASATSPAIAELQTQVARLAAEIRRLAPEKPRPGESDGGSEVERVRDMWGKHLDEAGPTGDLQLFSCFKQLTEAIEADRAAFRPDRCPDCGKAWDDPMRCSDSHECKGAALRQGVDYGEGDEGWPPTTPEEWRCYWRGFRANRAAPEGAVPDVDVAECPECGFVGEVRIVRGDYALPEGAVPVTVHRVGRSYVVQTPSDEDTSKIAAMTGAWLIPLTEEPGERGGGA